MTTIYSKTSFDRFGDDLCEVILSYLSFEDKIRFECVSQQFQRCVYGKVYGLNIVKLIKEIGSFGRDFEEYFKELAEQHWKNEKLGKIINKLCIRGLKLHGMSNDMEGALELVTNYCHNLIEIESEFYGLSENTFKQFFDKFGPKLKTIKTKLLSNYLFEGNNCLLKKLTKIKFDLYEDDIIDNKLELFIESNKKSLESVYVVNREENVSNILLKSLLNLSKLKEIRIDNISDNMEDFVNLLKQFGSKCTQLENISMKLLHMNSNTFLGIVKSLKYFKQLKSLKLVFNGEKENFILCHRSNEFIGFQYLSHLYLCSDNYVFTDEFFIDIDKNLPNLSILDIAKVDINDMSFKSLAKLTKLRKIHLLSNNSYTIITEPVVYAVINNCLKISSIYFGCKCCINLNEKNIDNIRKTNLNNYIEIHGYDPSYGSSDEDFDCSYEDYSSDE